MTNTAPLCHYTIQYQVCELQTDLIYTMLPENITHRYLFLETAKHILHTMFNHWQWLHVIHCHHNDGRSSRCYTWHCLHHL